MVGKICTIFETEKHYKNSTFKKNNILIYQYESDLGFITVYNIHKLLKNSISLYL